MRYFLTLGTRDFPVTKSGLCNCYIYLTQKKSKERYWQICNINVTLYYTVVNKKYIFKNCIEIVFDIER